MPRGTCLLAHEVIHDNNMHRAACGMPRRADWGNKLVMERQLMGKANIENRKRMKSNLETQPVLSFFEVGGGEGGIGESTSSGRG